MSSNILYPLGKQCNDSGGLCDNVLMNTVRCETGFNASDKSILCVDFGTSFVKTMLIDSAGYSIGRYRYADFSSASVANIIRNGNASLIVTGARAAQAETLLGAVPDVAYPEIDCLIRLPKCTGILRAVVACVGTGTPFIVCDNNSGEHIGGTGIGGGTFSGLTSRLLGIDDPSAASALAASGDINKINIMIRDLYNEGGVSYLKNDYTAANFAKTDTCSDADIALGIHSLVSETIGMMAAQIAQARSIKDIIFCGAVCENPIIAETLAKCLALFDLNPVFIEEPGFGVCFGAASIFCDS